MVEFLAVVVMIKCQINIAGEASRNVICEPHRSGESGGEEGERGHKARQGDGKEKKERKQEGGAARGARSQGAVTSIGSAKVTRRP